MLLFSLLNARNIDLITVLTAILSGRQRIKNLQWLYADPKSNNFCWTLALKKLWIANWRRGVKEYADQIYSTSLSQKLLGDVFNFSPYISL